MWASDTWTGACFTDKEFTGYSMPFALPRAALLHSSLWTSSQGLWDESNGHTEGRSKQGALRHTETHGTTEDTPNDDERGVWCHCGNTFKR